MNGGRSAGAQSCGVTRPSPGAPVARLSPRGAPPSPARGEGSLCQAGARGADASEKNSDELNEQTDEAENLRGNPQNGVRVKLMRESDTRLRRGASIWPGPVLGCSA